MTRFHRGMQFSLITAIGLVFAWQIGLLEAFGLGWQILLVPLALSLLSILFGIADSLVAPTPGKVLWLVGIALTVAPFLSDRVPVIALVAAFAAFALANIQRLREVYPA